MTRRGTGSSMDQRAILKQRSRMCSQQTATSTRDQVLEQTTDQVSPILCRAAPRFVCSLLSNVAVSPSPKRLLNSVAHIMDPDIARRVFGMVDSNKANTSRMVRTHLLLEALTSPHLTRTHPSIFVSFYPPHWASQRVRVDQRSAPKKMQDLALDTVARRKIISVRPRKSHSTRDNSIS